MADWNWMADAKCLSRDPSWWDYDKGQLTHNNRRAITTCGSCMVRLICLTAAIENDLDHGIWGGMTPAQRAQYKAGARPKVHKRDDAWTVSHRDGQATAGSWAAAIDFANRISPREKSA
jgi:WhiB family redox-sensing transcriptional regulator